MSVTFDSGIIATFLTNNPCTRMRRLFVMTNVSSHHSTTRQARCAARTSQIHHAAFVSGPIQAGAQMPATMTRANPTTHEVMAGSTRAQCCFISRTTSSPRAR